MMPRFDHWERLLAAFFAQHASTPFEWGRFDCALFACDAMHAMTGSDPAEAFRLQYDSARGAARKMKEFSGGGLEATAEKIAAARGMEEIPVELAQRGDVLFVEREGRPSLGIVGLDGVHGMFAGMHGVAPYPVMLCGRAWRVG